MVNPPDACHGPCHQGRAACPHPDACHRPSPDDVEPSFFSFKALLQEAALVGAVAASCGLLTVLLLARFA